VRILGPLKSAYSEVHISRGTSARFRAEVPLEKCI